MGLREFYISNIYYLISISYKFSYLKTIIPQIQFSCKQRMLGGTLTSTWRYTTLPFKVSTTWIPAQISGRGKKDPTSWILKNLEEIDEGMEIFILKTKLESRILSFNVYSGSYGAT